MSRRIKRLTSAVVGFTMVLAMMTPAFAQQTLGNVRGIVKDASGAVIPGAKVTILEKSTNKSSTTTSEDSGDYEFKNLPVGDYKLTVEAKDFKTLTLDDVRVQLNQTTDLPTTLTPGLATETVDISAGGAELIDSTTTNLAKGFESRQVVDLAQTATATGAGIYNLALIAPNVTSSGGIGVGTGGSIGGQRPRNNNFVVDGVDNNDKAVTGPQVYVSPEAVAEFSLLSNQYSAEFARSTGGQFITITKSGTNQFHGTAFGFFQNRHLNALDTLQKAKGITRSTDISDPLANPRSDFGRFGGNIGGPIIKDKLFFFGMYERSQTGAAASAGGISTPTATGFALLSGIPGLSSTNLGILKQFVPVAPSENGDVAHYPVVGGVRIPIGDVAFAAPSFSYNHNFIVNIDYNMSDKTQMKGRYMFNQFRGIDIAASLPAFFQPIPFDTRLFSFTLLHSFTPNLTNELRLAYRRSVSETPAGDFTYPGLDVFPNIDLDELGLAIGPDQNAPQSGIENNYQIVDTVSYLRGNHSFKAGGDMRKLISPQTFVQRSRGEYEYTDLNDYLHDFSGDFNERTIGVSPYEGNQKLLFLFGQDDWRIKPNLTLNLGLNYAYQQVPFSARQQTLNSIADVPGLLVFGEPKAQKKNFAPRLGFAYAPDYKSGFMHTLFGDHGKSSIRAGFSMAYDVIFDNLFILSLPPQFNQTIDVDPGIPNFFASGAIRSILQPAGTDPAAARAGTSAWIPDQQVPYSITYTASVQREFGQTWGLELRYLGTRGVHLLTQNRINIRPEVTDTNFIPTFFTTPTAADLAGLPTALSRFPGFPGTGGKVIPAFAAAGFNSNIVAFLSNGNSSYNGFSTQLTHRLSSGLQGSAAYTWSHLIDDTTAEVFSTVLSPRRVEDFQDLRRERADSGLDHRHRLTLSMIYDLPFFNNSRSLVRAIAGGWSLAGTYSVESGEKAAVQSGIDANLNGDVAGDRTIINTAGIKNTATTIHGVNSAGTTICGAGTTTDCGSAASAAVIRNVVAYVADDGTAQYVQAGFGARTNAARNTLQLPRINNLDFSIFKNFRITEGAKIQFRVDMFNAFNHAQFVPGSVNGVELTSQTSAAAANLVRVGTGDFNRPDQVFSSHPRVLQLALRFNF